MEKIDINNEEEILKKCNFDYFYNLENCSRELCMFYNDISKQGNNFNKEQAMINLGRIAITLNNQYKEICELQEDQSLLFMLVSGIDCLMHDKDYRFKNPDGTWYSRQSCRNMESAEVYQEIIDEINQLDSNFEILSKENEELTKQLKQSQNSKAIEVLEQVKETIIKNISPIIFQDSSWLGKQIVLDEIDNQITELKGEEND